MQRRLSPPLMMVVELVFEVEKLSLQELDLYPVVEIIKKNVVERMN